MKGERVLIDTSIWIEYFKNKDSRLIEKVDDVLTFCEVYVPKVVIAELIQGAKTEKEVSIIEEFTKAFSIIDHTGNTWLNAGKLSFSMKRKGMTVNIIDCYIALLAIENNCKIFSLDEHFRSIKRFIKLVLF